MSVRGLIDLAVERGQGPPRRRSNFVNASTEAAPPAPGAEGEEAPGAAAGEAPGAAALGLLSTVIPTEVVVLYTAWVAGTATRFAAEAGDDDRYLQSHDLLALRWTVYAVAVVAIVLVVQRGWKAKKAKIDCRSFAVAEVFAGTAAFVAWGLAMPGGLLGVYVPRDALDVVNLAVATVAALVLAGLGYGTLKQQTKKTS